MKGLIRLASGGLVACALCVLAPDSGAYEDYSGCIACHGDFRSNEYISSTDGQDWGNLHDLHRFTMLDGDCATCHSQGGFDPVLMGSSEGGEGFEPIGCVGCHGRNEDMGNDSISDGLGAGLRQHHTNAGIATCGNCHTDALPANYTPVGEDVLPSYYFTPDANHAGKPTAPCSPGGEEDYAGIAEGLDNDGNNVYDGADPACSDCDPENGDVTGDGCVSFADVLEILGRWGTTGDPGLPGDANCDGVVSFADILVVLGTWGQGCP